MKCNIHPSLFLILFGLVWFIDMTRCFEFLLCQFPYHDGLHPWTVSQIKPFSFKLLKSENFITDTWKKLRQGMWVILFCPIKWNHQWNLFILVLNHLIKPNYTNVGKRLYNHVSISLQKKNATTMLQSSWLLVFCLLLHFLLIPTLCCWLVNYSGRVLL